MKQAKYSKQVQTLQRHRDDLRNSTKSHEQALLEAKETHLRELQNKEDEMNRLHEEYELKSSEMSDHAKKSSKLQDEIESMREALALEKSKRASIQEKHDTHRQTFQETEIEFNKRISSFQINLKSSEKEMKDMEAAMKIRHDEEISSLENKMESSTQSFKDMESNMHTLRARLETAEQSSLAKHQAAQKRHDQKISDINSSLEDWKQRHEDLQRTSSKAAEQLKRMTNQMSEMDSRYESRLEERVATHEEKLKRTIEAHQSENDVLSRKIMQWEKRHNNLSDVLKQTKEIHKEATKKMEATISESEAQRAESLSAREAERRGSVNVVADLQGALAAERRENESWTKQLKKLRRNYVMMEQQLEESESRHQSLQSKHEKHQNEMQEMRMSMSSGDISARNLQESYQGELAEMRTREAANKSVSFKPKKWCKQFKA